MDKVILFGASSEGRLEEYINNWLKSNSDVEIIDIKYSTSQSCSDESNIYTRLSVLIHYKI